MFLFDWFRSFLPMHNPFGFGASDFLELALVGLLILLILARAGLGGAAARFAEKTGWVMLLLFALPIALRLCWEVKWLVCRRSGAPQTFSACSYRCSAWPTA